jgi:Protein of unknown function (DUF1569).
MKSVFDKETRDVLIERIHFLQENSRPQWGRMTVYQMIKHCRLWEEMISGKNKYKQAFIGRLFGKLALKSLLKNDSPLRRNTPTISELRVKDDGDLFSEKTKWVALMEENANYINSNFVHPFFGKMTNEQIGYLAYKHTDHHLRQFNC